jgi:outer membrane lipoprotein-sorting protein
VKIKLIITALFIFTANSYAAALGTSVNSSNVKISTVEELQNTVNSKMSQVNTISFSFTQMTYIAESTQVVKADVYFKKPDNLKVKYYKPQVQEIYLTGGYLYTYIPKIKQSTRQKSNDINDLLGVTTSVILSSESFSILKRDYKLDIIPDGRTNTSLLAVPIRKSNFDKMIITFVNNTGLPQKTVISSSHFNSETIFTDYVINPALSEDYFDFKPEKGTNIINID